MAFDKPTCDAARHLSEGADLHELKEAAQDLRALSPDSVLAQLVEEKIERILEEDAERRCTEPNKQPSQAQGDLVKRKCAWAVP